MRLQILEFARNLVRKISDELIEMPAPDTKLSDFDFDIVAADGVWSNAELMKINMLSYIFPIRVRNVMIRSQAKYFGLFEL